MTTVLCSFDYHGCSMGLIAVDHQSQEQMEYFFRKSDYDDAHQCLKWGDCVVRQKITVKH